MENLIPQYIASIGLAFPFAMQVTFRAAQLRGLNNENMEERVSDLTFDTLKEQICEQLQTLFHTYKTTIDNFNLPRSRHLNIQQIAVHIHGDHEDLDLLQNIYGDLVNQGMQSPHFVQALEYVVSICG